MAFKMKAGPGGPFEKNFFSKMLSKADAAVGSVGQKLRDSKVGNALSWLDKKAGG